jgi:dTDP-4-dehydrorhamnose 3,5-epimerase
VGVERTAIEGLLVVRAPTLEDDRGFFRQTYVRSELEAVLGRPLELRQANHSRSLARVLRGFHAEPWDKLVHVVRGTAFCALADIRPDSATFGGVATFTIGDPPGERVRLFVPSGVANSFYAVTECDYLYDVTEEWRPGVAKPAVAWDDPTLGVDWPDPDPLLSEADRSNPTLAALFPGHPRLA